MVLSSEVVQRGFREGSERVQRGLGEYWLSILPLNPQLTLSEPSLKIEQKQDKTHRFGYLYKVKDNKVFNDPGS